MTRLPVALLLAALALLSGCAGTQPYLPIDLQQIREAYATIPPIYNAFQVAYTANHFPAWLRLYRRGQQACTLVATIDDRDTIDPNTNLFKASADLDTLCNDMDSAYNGWRQAHGLSYDTRLPTTIPGTYFLDGDFNLTQIPLLLQHPATICCPQVGPVTATPVATTRVTATSVATTRVTATPTH